jgi:O-methyltransferase involved in polyketide biosynthesis
MQSTMAFDKNDIPPSALYTAATWRWGGITGAELVTPSNAAGVFRVVNAGSRVYRLLNPRWHSLKHTLLHRHIGIDRLLQQADCRQIIEIAAGFSPRGTAVSANSSIHYFEVDLAPVIGAKRRLLEATPAGQQVLARANLVLLEGDIFTLDWSGFRARPSFIITEGLMMYLDRAAQMQIWERIVQFLACNRGEYVFDYLPMPDEPARSFAGELLSRWRGQRRRRTFPRDGRSRDEIAEDLRAAGFRQVDMHSSREFASAWGLPHPKVHTRVILYRCRC